MIKFITGSYRHHLQPTMMLNTDTIQPPHLLNSNGNNVGSISNVPQSTDNAMAMQSPHRQAGICTDLAVKEQLQDNKSISGKLFHRLANLSYTSKKQNKKNSNTKSHKEMKKDRITMSNSENFLHNPSDHLSTLPRTTLSTRPRLQVQQNPPFHQHQFRTTIHQQEQQMSPHTLRTTTCQIPSPTEDPQHTNIIVNPYSSSQQLLMDRHNCGDTSYSHDCNPGLQEYNYASVVNEMGDPSTPFVTRNHLQSPSRLLQQRNPTLISNPLNSHHALVSPQLARLTRTLRHPHNVSGIYGGSTSSACTSSPNKTLLSALSSTSCSPRSDMTRYQNTASIFSNSTEMSDLNGSSLVIYQDQHSDDTLPLGTVLYDSYEDSSSNQHVYCEIPPVPPPPPAPSNRKPKCQMNFTGHEEELNLSNHQGLFRSPEFPRNGEVFHEDSSYKHERKDN